MDEFLKHRRPVAYSNKSLSDADTWYSNSERKLLGVVFGIEHFKHFTFGRKTLTITDHCSHRSLTNTTPHLSTLLLHVSKSLTNTTPHLSRLLLHVSQFDVQLHYQPRSRMKLSDALSRQSNHSIEADNKTEIRGLNVSIHEVDTDISEYDQQHRWYCVNFNQTYFRRLAWESRKMST